MSKEKEKEIGGWLTWQRGRGDSTVAAIRSRSLEHGRGFVGSRLSALVRSGDASVINSV